MNPADDAESKRPLFQSWVGKLRELPENAKMSSVRFPEVSGLIPLRDMHISRHSASSGRFRQQPINAAASSLTTQLARENGTLSIY